MNNNRNNNNTNSSFPRLLRGKQAGVMLKAAIVGGGPACMNLLEILDDGRLSRLNMEILGVSDLNSNAPGYQKASELGLFTTTDFNELFSLKGLNLVIELTGSQSLSETIFKAKPSGVSLMDFRTARLLWDLIQFEVDKKELEREQQQYEQNNKKETQIILDSLPYRIMVVNMEMMIETVNQTFLREFNLSADEIVGKHCYEVRYKFSKPCTENGTSCYIEDGLDEIKDKKLISRYIEYQDSNGESRWDVITIAPIFNDEGEIIQLLEASRDVTDRIKLEHEVQKSNTFFQKVIQSTVDGIVVVDTKGNVMIFNEGIEGLTGYSSEEMVNEGHITNFYDIDVAKENMKKMRSDQFGPPGKLNPTSMTIKTKHNQDIPITLTASVITIDDKEIGSVGVFTDMREVLEMRKNLEEAHLQLVQSEKIASVGRMAAGVAHEINNPLSGIMLYAELLKDSLKDEEQHLADLQEIIDQTIRCKKIVSDLLEFSRQSVGSVSSFSIDDMITKSLNLLINQAIFQNIDVRTDIQKELPLMVGDIGQLQQVFTNLFINAADAMGGTGRLEITTYFNQERELFIIKVSDNGPGIPEDLRDKIFDIFFTTKQVGKGTGLGLSISQNIIKLHGGTIALNCPPEGGTSFVIELPLGFVDKPEEEPLFIGLDE